MKKLLFLVFLTCLSANLLAQGTTEDYKRAFEQRAKYSGKVFYDNVQPNWIGDTHCFWYVRNTPEGRIYVIVDAAKQKRTELFNHDKLAKALSDATKREFRAKGLNLERLTVEEKLDVIHFQANGHRWIYNTRKNQLTEESTPQANAFPQRPMGRQRHWMERDDELEASPVPSPDGKYTAYIKNHNIYVRERATGRERQLSIDGTLANYYSAYIQWSPDSRKVVSCKIRPTEKRYVYYVESSPADQLQPKLHKQEYAKPGDELPFKVPCIYEVETGRAIIPSTDLFEHQYNISRPRWDKDSRTLTFEFNERGHQNYRILELSAEDGSVRPIIEESSDKYVNYSRIFRHHLKDGRRIIWSSERDNWNHLYMYDRTTGQPLHQITKGEWYVREIVRIDEENELIYFTANGVQTDEDPYHIRYYRVGFDGNGFTDLTPERGTHKAWFSRDMQYLVDVYSTANDAPVTVLRDAKDGHAVMALETADITRLEAEGWRAPEVFAAKGRDGKTDMWGLIIRPSNFDPTKQYPILEYIYQGPGDHYVPKTFTAHHYYINIIYEIL